MGGVILIVSEEDFLVGVAHGCRLNGAISGFLIVDEEDFFDRVAYGCTRMNAKTFTKAA